MIHLWSWLQVGIDVQATLRLAAKEPLVEITVSRMFFYIYEHFLVSRSSTYWRESMQAKNSDMSPTTCKRRTLTFYSRGERIFTRANFAFLLFWFVWTIFLYPSNSFFFVFLLEFTQENHISSGQQAKKCSKRVFPNILHYGTDGRWYGVGIK